MKTDSAMAAHASPEPTIHATGRRLGGRPGLGRLRDFALIPALVILFVLGALVSPSFLTRDNLIGILSASAALALVVVAETLIILTGKFDLSVESTVGFAPAMGAMLVIPAAAGGFGTELPVAAGLAATLLTGACVGLLNGLLVVKLRLNAFIVTLAMLIVLRGMLVGATRGSTLFDMPQPFFALASSTLLGLPWSVWLAAFVFAAAGVMLRYHRLGRAVYAIGGNAPAARAAGINVDRVTWGVFTLAGTLAALGGLILTGYVGAINANQGNGMIFTVFAAAVIGGVSLDGGKGGMFGALCGVLLLGMVQNLLTLAQVPSFWIQAIYGAIILGALMVAKLTGENQQ